MNTKNRDPYAASADNCVALAPGDLVRVRLPHSEAMMAARKAGQVHIVRLGRRSAQLIDDVGDEWGGPYLPSECGIYGAGIPHNPYYTYGVKVKRS